MMRSRLIGRLTIASAVAATTAVVALSSAARPTAQNRALTEAELARCGEIKTMIERYTAPGRDPGTGAPTKPAREAKRDEVAQKRLDLALMDAVIARLQREPAASRSDLTTVMRQEASRQNKTVPEALIIWLGAIDAANPASRADAARGSRRGTESDLTRATEEENAMARMVNLLEDQQLQMGGVGCPDRPVRSAFDPLANRGTGDTGAEAGGAGAAAGTGAAGGTGAVAGGGQPPVVPPPVNASLWVGEWVHEFGNMVLSVNTGTDFVLGRVRTANSFGPAMTCDGVQAYSGDVQWTGGGSYGGGLWDAEAWACTNGGYLEGKFTNFGMGRAPGTPVRAGSFRVAMKQDKSDEYEGTYTPYDVVRLVSAAGGGWTAKRSPARR